MSYNIQIERKALKFIQKQSPEQRRRILAAIYRLPTEGDIKPLEGSPGLFSLRVGDYRIIYSVDHGKTTVYVVKVGNRGDVYKA